MEDFDLNYVEEQMGKPVTGIVHIGAHYGEEAAEYDAHKPGMPVIWFEAHPDYATKLHDHLEQFPNQHGFEACLSDVSGQTVEFHITADEYASSMLKPAYHQVQNPHAYETGTIQLVTERFEDWTKKLNPPSSDATNPKPPDVFNFLTLDVQGAELKVWGGMSAGNRKQFDAIASEYSTVEFYEGVPHIAELDDAYEGFERVYPLGDDVRIHGNGLWVRR